MTISDFTGINIQYRVAKTAEKSGLIPRTM